MHSWPENIGDLPSDLARLLFDWIEHFDVPRENAAYHDRFEVNNLFECYRWMCHDLHNCVSVSDLAWTNLEILESEPRIRTMYLEISITNVLRSKGLISVADGFLGCFLSPWCLWKWFGVQFGRVLSRKPWIRRKSLGSAPKPRIITVIARDSR